MASDLYAIRVAAAGQSIGIELHQLVQALSRESGGVLAMGQSTLYPMLYNLEAKKLVASRVDKSGPRPRKYYRLTNKGLKRLSHDTQQWRALLEAMASLGVLGSGDGIASPQAKGGPA